MNLLVQPWFNNQVVHFIQILILFSNVVHYQCDTLVWNQSNRIFFFISNVDTDALVLHQGISGHSAQYAPMRFQVFRG